MRSEPKPLFWVGAAKKELMALPGEVQDVFGYALFLAQVGSRHENAKPLKGFSGTFEVVDDFRGDTYRAIYTVEFKDAVYVLHCFQKKSKKGIKTPKPNMDIIKARIKALKLKGE